MVRVAKLPFKGLWFLIKHPIITLVLILLLAFSSISFLAHFNPAIAERFNSAAVYFGAATLASTISDKLRVRERTLENVSKELIETKSKLNTANIELDDFKQRKIKFANAGKKIEKRAVRRFTKVAVYDIAGEFIGWVPVAGDAASIALAAGGIYEMCQMFKEIEAATTELGVPYQVYTDTFCEKPVKKTKELIAEKTGAFKDKIVATTTVFKDYASKIPTPDKDSFTAEIRSKLDQAYAFIASVLYGN